MAAVEGVTFVTDPPTTEDHHKEPSLTYLREMLVGIKITENIILLESKKINEGASLLRRHSLGSSRKPKECLRRTLRRRKRIKIHKQQTEIVDHKKQLTNSVAQLAAAEKELDESKKRINDQQEEIGELYDLQDRLEQYTRKIKTLLNSLEFLYRRSHP